MKNIVIFGDSYSTFRDHIPEGFKAYYTPTIDPQFSDVNQVEYTWWHMLAREASVNIVQNNSWSGSTVCYAGEVGERTYIYAFIYRLEQLISEGFFDKNDIDTVIVFGGTNDSWRDLPLGEDNFDTPTEDALHSFRPAMCKMIKRLRAILPGATVLSVINSDLKPEIGECIRNASEHFGTHYLELRDIDKAHGHPTKIGMVSIKDQILGKLTELEA